ncbi:hypothetical protein F5884DRAFT_263543 [Xylogone sp. PMI_703]|nr:hypothetical protein F5884DRAFT_263543 [Xylogone sp. PMI_703]
MRRASPLPLAAALLALRVTNAQSVFFNSSVPPTTASFSPAGPYPTDPTDLDGEVGGLEQLFTGYGSTDALLSQYCVSSAIANATNQPIITTTFTEAVQTTIGGTQTLISVVTTETGQFEPITFASPCCSSCTVLASKLQLIYWPTPAPSDFTGSTIVNSEGFTFTSPSVYIAFNDLSASNLCGAFATITKPVTISVPPNEISSVFGSGNQTGTRAVNFADFNGCPSSFPPDDNFTNTSLQSEIRRCSPFIPIPTEVVTADPRFSGCIALPLGSLLDPPSVLTSATGILPPSSTPPASPVSSVTPISPPSTTPALPESSPPASTPSSTSLPPPPPPPSSSTVASAPPPPPPPPPPASSTSSAASPPPPPPPPPPPSSSSASPPPPPPPATSSTASPPPPPPPPSAPSSSAGASQQPPPPPPAASSSSAQLPPPPPPPTSTGDSQPAPPPPAVSSSASGSGSASVPTQSGSGSGEGGSPPFNNGVARIVSNFGLTAMVLAVSVFAVFV